MLPGGAVFSAEGELGGLDTGRFTVPELTRTKSFKFYKTKASLANKRSQNPGPKRGKKADFTIVSQTPTVSPHCGPQFNSMKNGVYIFGAPESLQMVTAAMKLKDTCSLDEKL